MGHPRYLTDKEAIERLCSDVWALAEEHVFRPSRKWVLDFSCCQIEASSFEVSASMLADQGSEHLPVVDGQGSGVPKLLRLRFRSRVRQSGDWFLHVRYRAQKDRPPPKQRFFTRRKMRGAFSPVMERLRHSFNESVRNPHEGSCPAPHR